MAVTDANLSPEYLTIRQVQEKYINMDSRKLRAFLNEHCHYLKIGKNYFYNSKAIEKLLDTKSESKEFNQINYYS